MSATLILRVLVRWWYRTRHLNGVQKSADDLMNKLIVGAAMKLILYDNYE